MSKKDFEQYYCKPKNKIVRAAGLPYRCRAEKDFNGDYCVKWNYSDLCANLADSLIAASKVKAALSEYYANNKERE